MRTAAGEMSSRRDSACGSNWGVAERFGKVLPYRKGWRLDLRPYGYLYTDQGLRFESEAHAAGVLASIRREIANGAAASDIVRRLLPKDGKQDRVRVHLERWLEAKSAREAAGELSPEHLRNLRRECRPTGYFGPLLDRSIHSLTYGVLEDWLFGLTVKGKTKRNAASDFHAFLSWLRRRGELSDLPDFPTVPTDEYLPTIISLEDQDRVIAKIPAERRGAFLAARLGLRPSEVRALNMEDYREGCLAVAHGMKGPSAHHPRRGTKSRRFRFVELDPELATWIAEYRRDAIGEAPLFVNPTGRRSGGRWLGSALRQEWNRAARSLGIHARMYEGTKHSSASAAARRGVRLEVIQQALGHADPRSTARYARLAPIASVTVLRPECNLSAGVSGLLSDSGKQK